MELCLQYDGTPNTSTAVASFIAVRFYVFVSRGLA